MYISKQEQQQLFEEYKTPAHVIAHCNEVARVAKVIAAELNAHGYNLDIDLLYGAALVHDVVRVREHHAEEGAAILREKGYLNEAKLVEKHMNYFPFNEINNIDEQDVLCLADRVVKENKYVGISERMDYLLKKSGVTEERKKGIHRAMEHTSAFIKKIEDVIDMPLNELCTEK